MAFINIVYLWYSKSHIKKRPGLYSLTEVELSLLLSSQTLENVLITPVFCSTSTMEASVLQSTLCLDENTPVALIFVLYILKAVSPLSAV